MDPDIFIQDRVDNQINWYDKKSTYSKRWFHVLVVMELLFAASLPVFSGFNTSQSRIIDIVIGIIGFLIVILNGLLSQFKFKDHWKEYRTTAEQLKHEKYLFLTQTDLYSSEDAYSQFVTNIENLISKENSSWGRILKSDEKK